MSHLSASHPTPKANAEIATASEVAEVSEIYAWLDAFAACVRNRDYAGGQRLFSPNVHGFGTRTREALGMAALLREQWQPTWERTRDFAFLYDASNPPILVWSADRSQVVVMVSWSSWGVDTPADWEHQEPYHRQGRSTLVLQKSVPDWLAIHTHFSMDPEAVKRGVF